MEGKERGGERGAGVESWGHCGWGGGGGVVCGSSDVDKLHILIV